MKTFVSYCFFAFILFFFLAGIILQTSAVQQFAKQWIEEKIAQQTGLKVEIEHIALYPTFQANASHVTLYDASHAPKLSIAHVHIGLYPHALLQGVLHIHTLYLKDVRYFAAADSSSLSGSLPTVDTLPTDLKVDLFHVDGLTVVQQTPLPEITVKGSLYAAPSRSLIEATLSAGKGGDDRPIQIALTAQSGKGTLQLQGPSNLACEAEFSLDSDAMLHISRLSGTYRIFHIDGSARVKTTGEMIDASLRLSTEDLAALSPLHGSVHGEATVQGSLFQPVVNVNMTGQQLKLLDAQLPDAQLHLFARETPRGFLADASLAFSHDDIPYTFAGTFSFQHFLHPFPATFFMEAPVEQIAPLLQIEADLLGKLALAIEIKQDGFQGKATLSNGYFESYTRGLILTDIQAQVAIEATQLKLTEFSAKSDGPGTLRAFGTLDLDAADQFPLNFSIQMEHMKILQLDNASSSVSGVFRLTGSLYQPILKGTMKTEDAVINIPEHPRAAVQSVDVIYVNQSSKERPPTAVKAQQIDIPLELDIAATVDSVQIKGKDFTSKWKGTLRIQGFPSSAKVTGELLIKKGHYKALGRTLNLKEGIITLNGDFEKNSSLYVIAEMDVNKYTIEVIVKGPLNNPSIGFRSNPPLTRKEILSWLLFNKDISDLSEFQGSRLNQSIIHLSSSVDKGPSLIDKIEEALGIDRIDIGGSPDASQFSFELGKYVSDKTYIFFSRKPAESNYPKRIGTGTLDPDVYDQTNRIGIETGLGKNIKLQAEVDEDQCGQMNLLWKKDY